MTLRDQLMRHEGFRLWPYKDSVGKTTWGYGHNLEDEKLPAEARALIERAAAVVLDHDISQAFEDARTFTWFADLCEARQAVVCNMVFNMGLEEFSQFRNTIAAIRARDWDEAAREMLDSRWAVQVGPRADELATQMRLGSWIDA